MHRALLPLLVATACAPASDLERLTYGGGDGLSVTFLPVEGPAAEGAVALAGAAREHLTEACPPGEARILTKNAADGGLVEACVDALTGFPGVPFGGGLAGPLPLREAFVQFHDGVLENAGLVFDETEDARVSVELEVASAELDVARGDPLEGTVTLNVAWDHVGPFPDHVRTEWEQTVRFSWSFDPAVREVTHLENEGAVEPVEIAPG